MALVSGGRLRPYEHLNPVMSFSAQAVLKLPKFSPQPQALPGLHPPRPPHFLLTPWITLPEPHQPPPQARPCLRVSAWAVHPSRDTPSPWLLPQLLWFSAPTSASCRAEEPAWPPVENSNLLTLPHPFSASPPKGPYNNSPTRLGAPKGGGFSAYSSWCP